MGESRVTKMINTKLLDYADYQRGLKSKWVDEIAKNFSEPKANIPKVSFRDNKYYVFDGQHTIAARKKLNNGNDLDVYCEVYSGLSLEREAELYNSFNTNRKPLTALDKAKAALMAGDPETVDLVNIVKETGYDIKWVGGLDGSGKFTCIKKLQDVYKKYGSFFLKNELQLLNEIWQRTKESLREEIVGGLAVFYDTYSNCPEFKKDTFVERMKVISPEAIIREGKQLSIPGDKRFAKAMVNHYNKKRSKGKLDVSKLE